MRLLLLVSAFIGAKPQNIFLAHTGIPTENPISSSTSSLAPSENLTPRPETVSPTITPSRMPFESSPPSSSDVPSLRPSVTAVPTGTPTVTARASYVPSLGPSFWSSVLLKPSSGPIEAIAPGATGTHTGMPIADFPFESLQPTPSPSVVLTEMPMRLSSSTPKRLPSDFVPTESPAPSPSPTFTPTEKQTYFPSIVSNSSTSNKPTLFPAMAPILSPTLLPTLGPTLVPIAPPTLPPTLPPTFESTLPPTLPPTFEPTSRTTDSPSAKPIRSLDPSNAPTIAPTKEPSNPPTLLPTVSATPTIAAQVDYFSMPRRKWSVQIDRPYSSQLRKGNAVTLSPDNVLLYITHNNGQLTVLHAHDGTERWSYMPTNFNENQWSISCQSGVYFGQHPTTGEEFAVYAIIDTPTDGGLQQPKSRVVAIAHPYNRVMWVSPSFPGTVVGTPVISRSLDTRGLYVFVTHNILLEGYFSVLLTKEDGAMHFTEGSGDKVATDRLPYAPMAVDETPWAGKYFGGLSNSNDVMLWSSSSQEGRGPFGYNRAFQVPQNYDPEIGGMATIRLVSVSSNAIARPTVGSRGFDLFTVGTGNVVSGWVLENGFGSDPSWSNRLQAGPDQTAPIENAVVLSKDERRLFSSSTSTVFHAMYTSTGQEAWKRLLDSTPMVEAKVTLDDQRVYVIEAADGTVVAMDQTNGNAFYSVTCNIHEANCARRVEAEFDRSDDGLFLYYGDINGKINAIVLGVSLLPTVPSTDYPSFAPQPSASPTNEASATLRPSRVDDIIPSALPSVDTTSLPLATSFSHQPSSASAAMPQMPSQSPSTAPSLEPSRAPLSFPEIQGPPPTSVAIGRSFGTSMVVAIWGLFVLQS